MNNDLKKQLEIVEIVAAYGYCNDYLIKRRHQYVDVFFDEYYLFLASFSMETNICYIPTTTFFNKEL